MVYIGISMGVDFIRKTQNPIRKSPRNRKSKSKMHEKLPTCKELKLEVSLFLCCLLSRVILHSHKIWPHLRSCMHIIRPLVKSVYQKILISQPKHMSWVLKRTVSMKKKYLQFYAQKLCLSRNMCRAGFFFPKSACPIGRVP